MSERMPKPSSGRMTPYSLERSFKDLFGASEPFVIMPTAPHMPHCKFIKADPCGRRPLHTTSKAALDAEYDMYLGLPNKAARDEKYTMDPIGSSQHPCCMRQDAVSLGDIELRIKKAD